MQNPRAFRLGLLGHPVSHSRSPEIFAAFFRDEGLDEAEYQLFDLPSIEDFPSFLQAQLNQDLPLIGFNVTVPHKVGILDHLDWISAGARAVGAVNTVLVQQSDTGITLSGHNTDVDGFAHSLTRMHNPSHPEISNAIILGNGGSAKAVKFVLEQEQIPFVGIPLCNAALPTHEFGLSLKSFLQFSNPFL